MIYNLCTSDFSIFQLFLTGFLKENCQQEITFNENKEFSVTSRILLIKQREVIMETTLEFVRYGMLLVFCVSLTILIILFTTAVIVVFLTEFRNLFEKT